MRFLQWQGVILVITLTVGIVGTDLAANLATAQTV